MARNSGGTYSLPAGNPVVSGTPIASTWANTLTGDISTEITNSLERNGKGGMLAPLRGVDGTVAAPSFSFTNETGSGWFRESAGVIKAAILGTYRLLLNATGLQINGTLTVSGGIDRPSLPAVGQQVSTSCANFTTTSATFVDVTNLTVTITTTGRPVVLLLQPDGNTTNNGFLGSLGTTDTTGSTFQFVRGSTSLGLHYVYSQPASATATTINVPPGVISNVDVIGAGTYTYKVQAKRDAATDTARVYYCKLVAYEL